MIDTMKNNASGTYRRAVEKLREMMGGLRGKFGWEGKSHDGSYSTISGLLSSFSQNYQEFSTQK